MLSEIDRLKTPQLASEATRQIEKQMKKKSPYRASWGEQFTALLWRGFLAVIKEPMVIRVNVGQTIVS